MCKNSTNNSKKQGNNKSENDRKSRCNNERKSKITIIKSRDTTVPVTKPPKTGK